MTHRSRYDELHDRYHAILTIKAGTRYELLAAMVFKILEDRNVVIHDLKLVGDSSVAHQIDVSIEVNGHKRRVVVECKDFDVSGDKVGLDIIRNFRSVIEDTHADEGIVLSCTGYTKDAQKFAKAKNVKLAVLRSVEPIDLEGTIQTVVLNLTVEVPAHRATTISMSESSMTAFSAECERIGIRGSILMIHPVFLVRAQERVRFNTFIGEQINNGPITKTDTGLCEVKTMGNGWSLQVDKGPLIPFDFITTTFQVAVDSREIKVTSERVAELILMGLGEDDILIFGDELERRKIDPKTGEIL